MLSNEWVEESLKEAGLWRKENLYFIAVINKPAWKVALEYVNTFAAILSKNTFAILNQTEEGIGILPIKVGEHPEALPHLSAFIPDDQWQSIAVKKAFMARKVAITTADGKTSSFTVESKNSKVANHQENFERFLARYQ